MPGPSPTPLLINPALTAALRRVATSTTEQHARVVRARVVLLAADGRPVPEIARRTGQSERTVRKWKARFAALQSIEALNDARRSGRPSSVPIEARLAVIRVACERPDGEKKPKCFRDIWTQQALADEVARRTRTALSRSEVGRILRFNMLRPHMVRQWLRSPDPLFDAKAARVCDLYLNAPADAVVVCIDEKPIQVIARKHPTLVARDASLRREFEYVRHGTRCLLAAFDVRTGRVITELVPHRTADALVAFVQRVADAYPGKTVYVVWDNLNTHGEGKAQRWTRFNERNGGRFHFVRTPLHASWLNQVECWFSILQRRVIRYGNFANADVLHERVIGFATLWNEVEAHPFRWTWRSDRAEAPRRNAAA
jgi:transposase